MTTAAGPRGTQRRMNVVALDVLRVARRPSDAVPPDSADDSRPKLREARRVANWREQNLAALARLDASAHVTAAFMRLADCLEAELVARVAVDADSPTAAD